MPINILYVRGFSLTIGKRSGKRQNRACTDKKRFSPEKPNETWRFCIHPSTDEHGFPRLLQQLLCVKVQGDGGEEIVDNFSAERPLNGILSPSEALRKLSSTPR